MEICHHLFQRLGCVWLMLFLRQGHTAQAGLELRAALLQGLQVWTTLPVCFFKRREPGGGGARL